MSNARKYVPHYTVSDYETWEGEWELWQGIAVSMTPSPFGDHQRVAKNLVFEIERQIREQPNCDALLLYEIDWIASDDTVLRPDLLVLCGEAPRQHVEKTPSLVAEILSESTASRDRIAKCEMYDQHGVGTYLLVDPKVERLEAFTRGPDGAWVQRHVADAIDLRLCESCELTIHRNSLFNH